MINATRRLIGLLLGSFPGCTHQALACSCALSLEFEGDRESSGFISKAVRYSRATWFCEKYSKGEVFEYL